jgi:hypothetical protein
LRRQAFTASSTASGQICLQAQCTIRGISLLAAVQVIAGVRDKIIGNLGWGSDLMLDFSSAAQPFRVLD